MAGLFALIAKAWYTNYIMTDGVEACFSRAMLTKETLTIETGLTSGITQEKLSTVLGTVDTDTTILRADSGQAPKAPGMKYRHYAPRGELTIVEGTPEQVREYINRAAAADHTAGEKTGIIGTEEMLSGYIADVVKSVGSRKDEGSIARHLYTILREFDDEGVTKIYSEGFSTEGFGQAIMNRLLKAAGHKVVKL